MVTSVLRVMDLSELRSFQRYHLVLNCDVWRSLDLSRVLLRPLVMAFVPEGPRVFGIDGTIERRRGAKIKAASIYRDPVRSSHSHLVKVNGLRWLHMPSQRLLSGFSQGTTARDHTTSWSCYVAKSFWTDHERAGRVPTIRSSGKDGPVRQDRWEGGAARG
jgi:hypothetical protein